MSAWPILNWAELCDHAEGETEKGSFLIEGLWPANGYVLLAAPSKAGKSTFVAHLIQSLTTGTPFLSSDHAVENSHRVCLIDTEMTASAIKSYIGRAGDIRNENLTVVTARARLSEIDLFSKTGREAFARDLQPLNLSVLIFDCLSPYLEAHNINEDKDAGRAIVAIRETARLANIPNLLIVHHTGHDGARARGSSSLLGSSDVNWLIKRSSEQAAAKRTFQAQGRGDIDTEQKQIRFNPERQSISFGEAFNSGANSDARMAELRQSIFRAILENPGVSTQGIKDLVGGRTQAISDVLSTFKDGMALQSSDGQVLRLTISSKGKARIYTINPA